MRAPSAAVAGAVMVPAYRAPSWLVGGHAQTIFPFLLKRGSVVYRRERVDTRDGDFWDFDWLEAAAGMRAGGPGTPLAVLFHGLEGSSRSHYASALMTELARRGWRGVVPHFRGCGGEPNRQPRAYHSGDHEEIGALLEAVRARAPDARLFAVGVSLGGSALLNWLGRAGGAAGTMLEGAAAVCAPLDLTAAGAAIDRGLNRIVYARHFLGTLKPKGLGMAERFPGVVDPVLIRRARSLYEFDDVVTAPLHGFAGTEDYWQRASSKPWLRRIELPTLVLNARNDPFVPASSLPGPDEASGRVRLEQPEQGGHVGFLTGAFPGRLTWLPQRLLQFFVRGV